MIVNNFIARERAPAWNFNRDVYNGILSNTTLGGMTANSEVMFRTQVLCACVVPEFRERRSNLSADCREVEIQSS